VLKQYGSPMLTDALQSSLLGSHPAFFDFMVKVAGALNTGFGRASGRASGGWVPEKSRWLSVCGLIRSNAMSALSKRVEKLEEETGRGDVWWC